MVLNKSKWDHKAKIQYLRKHNLTRPKQNPEKNTPKWSGKKNQDVSGNSWLDESDDSEWDSEDDAFLNHFYPQISEDNLSVENKRKLKQQIVKIVKKREAGDSNEPEDPPKERDGIYLGTEAQKSEAPTDSGSDDEEHGFSDEEFELEIPDLEVKLSEFVVSDLGKSRNRKMLKNKISDNLLDEYGLESYSSTVKDTDYNSSVKNQFRNVSKLTADDLHGLRIGETSNAPKQPAVRALSEAELQQHKERAAKLQHVRFHDQIKKKFGSDSTQTPRVLEINNFNANDKDQMASLNTKLTSANENSRQYSNVEDDLDELLGLEGDKQASPVSRTAPETLDFLSETLPQATTSKKESDKKESRKVKPATDSFLDDLLGI
ncbi:hypothetical protein JCM33374_g3724 [Metschnikowia sp. JCM 33374]|nr:hypothetical protein JCM33374_g3724 [Metschnikowia sp. JCM 33374]